MKEIAEKAIAYGTGVYFINIIFSVLVILIMVIYYNIFLAIIISSLSILFMLILNYKKYYLMKELIKVSFFRTIILDTVFISIGYIIIMLENEYGYLALITCIIPAIASIPLVKTNKKIKLSNYK